MALDTITPSNREEEYLSAIAGDEGASAPVPSNRREEWLRRIAEHGESIPTVPEAGDSGKVWTAGSDGSASWETASGGGGVIMLYLTEDTPALTDLPVIDPALEWVFTEDPPESISLTENGTALTYTELLNLPKNAVYCIYDPNSPEVNYKFVTGIYYILASEFETFAEGDELAAYLSTRDSSTYGISVEISAK